jgi:hypothetical protein
LNKGTVSSIATRIKKLSEQADSIPAALDSSKENFANQAQARDECSDEYCLEHHIEPPRFAYYKQVRKDNPVGEPWEYDARQTMDERDYYLKMRLHEPPEERYQAMKDDGAIMFHPSNMDGKHNSFTGCSNLKCVPGCRFEAPYGRVEDSEVIAEVDVNKNIEKLYDLMAVMTGGQRMPVYSENSGSNNDDDVRPTRRGPEPYVPVKMHAGAVDKDKDKITKQYELMRLLTGSS